MGVRVPIGVILAVLGLSLVACGHGSYRVEGTPWAWMTPTTDAERALTTATYATLPPGPPLRVSESQSAVAAAAIGSGPTEATTVRLDRKQAKKRSDGKRRKRRAR